MRGVVSTCNLELESVNQLAVNDKRMRLEAVVTVFGGFGMISLIYFNVVSTLEV